MSPKTKFRTSALFVAFLLVSCQGDRQAPALPKDASLPLRDPNHVAIDPNQPPTAVLPKTLASGSPETLVSEGPPVRKPLDLTLPPGGDLTLPDGMQAGGADEGTVLPDLFNTPKKQSGAKIRSKLLTNEHTFDPGEPHKSLEMIDGAEVTIEKRL